MANILNTILRLRRDNDYNYKLIENSFIPANGEICLVDTATMGLRAVCGDGVSTFAELSFCDSKLIKGLYKDGAFYNEENEVIPSLTSDIYFDISTNDLYIFNGSDYEILNDLPTANENVAGITKLYNGLGNNEDGTMTQKAITDELNQKVEISFSPEDDELLIFSY